MPRTDEQGKQLYALLGYLLDGVESRDIFGALAISSSTYYRRIREHDYPHAEELRKVAAGLGLSSADLQVRFGLAEPRRREPSTPTTVTTSTAVTQRQHPTKLDDTRFRMKGKDD